MREFLSITIIVTICFFTVDALFMDGQYRGEVWKDAGVQIHDFSRATKRVALGLVN